MPQSATRLRAIILALQRHRFGRRSEQLDPDQLALGLEDLEQSLAAAEAQEERSGTSKAGRPAGARSTAGHCRRICRGSRW